MNLELGDKLGCRIGENDAVFTTLSNDLLMLGEYWENY